MAIRMQQQDKTPTSVTIQILGITGDRQTYIWVPTLTQSNKWMKLNDALNEGRIAGYSVGGADNEEITVEMIPEDADRYKVWDFYVNDITGNGTYTSGTLHTVLGFEFENAAEKQTGKSIDITRKDLRALNYIGRSIDIWINRGNGDYYYPFDEENGEAPLFADYLAAPASYIWSSANNFKSNDLLINFSDIIDLSVDIKNLKSGDVVRAKTFNDFKTVIDEWRMRCGYDE